MNRRLLVTYWLFASALLIGCDRSAPTANETIDIKTTRRMALLYQGYMDVHGGQAPKDEAAFRAYLAGQEAFLKSANLSVDQMFVSPRGDGPLHWFYGNTPAVDATGSRYFAYEATPVNGKRLAIGVDGQFKELDESKFKSAFPNAN